MTTRCDGPACAQIRGRREAATIALRLNDENAVLHGRIETMRGHVREAADLLDVLQHGSIVIEPGGACDRVKAILKQILEVG